jgi:hypothetical protein
MTCDYCGGDGVTHLAVAYSLSKKANTPIAPLLEMPCTLVNRLHKALVEAGPTPRLPAPNKPSSSGPWGVG